MPKEICWKAVTEVLLVNPIARFLFVSLAVTSTYPSPDAIIWLEVAPVLQPSPAMVRVRLLLATDRPTALVHTALCRFEVMTAPVTVLELVYSDPAAYSG